MYFIWHVCVRNTFVQNEKRKMLKINIFTWFFIIFLLYELDGPKSELPCLCFEVTRLFGSPLQPVMRSLNSDQQQIKGRQDDDAKDVYAGVYH